MNNKILKNILIIGLLLICIMINNTVWAAGSFTLSKSSATITEGKTTTFSINGSSATGRVDITSSNSSVATVSSSSEWLENSSSTITITAKKAGTATITVTGTVADAEGNEADITKTIKVTVKAKQTTNNSSNSSSSSSNNSSNSNSSSSSSSTTNKDTETTTKEKSSNAYLSTLGVTPKEYDFSGFSKTKTSYSVTVPSDVDSLKVLYKTADSNATVKVSGNSGFEVGSDNEIAIKVTAEDGKTTKTYTIKVTKLAEEEEKPGNVIEDDEGLYLTSLELEGIDLSPEFEKDTYSYTAKLSDSNVNEVKVNAKANNEKAIIEISGNTELVEGENTINIILKLEDSDQQIVYQIIVDKEANSSTDTVTELPDDTSNNNSGIMQNLKEKAIIIILACIFIAVIAIVICVLKRKKADEEYFNDTNEEYNNRYEIYEDEETTERVRKRRGKHSK